MFSQSYKKGLWTFVALTLASTSVYAQGLEQRVDRLERIADNPILLQHSQRIESQQREIQGLYDQVDHLTRQLSQLKQQLDAGLINAEGRLENLENQIDSLSLTPSAVIVEAEFAPAADLDLAVYPSDDLGTSKLEGVGLGESSLEDLESNLKDTLPADEPPVLSETQVVLTLREQYDQAFQLLRESKFDQSIVLFSQFTEQNPQHALTSNSFYWLGEAYMIKQDFEQAYHSFDRVIKQFNDTNKYPDALLRGADSLVGLNRLDEAQAMYRTLIEQAPDSRSAKTAVRRLERFN